MSLCLVHDIVELADLLLVCHALTEIAEFDRHKDSTLEQVFLQLARVEALIAFFEFTGNFLLFLVLAYTMVRKSCFIALLHLLKQEKHCLQTVLQIALLLVVERCAVQGCKLTLEVESVHVGKPCVVFMLLLSAPKAFALKEVLLL